MELEELRKIALALSPSQWRQLQRQLRADESQRHDHWRQVFARDLTFYVKLRMGQGAPLDVAREFIRGITSDGNVTGKSRDVASRGQRSGDWDSRRTATDFNQWQEIRILTGTKPRIFKRGDTWSRSGSGKTIANLICSNHSSPAFDGWRDCLAVHHHSHSRVRAVREDGTVDVGFPGVCRQCS